jgi:hypothetical protein
MPTKKIVDKVTGNIQKELDKKFDTRGVGLNALIPYDSPAARAGVRDYRKKKIDGIANKGKTRGNR